MRPTVGGSLFSSSFYLTDTIEANFFLNISKTVYANQGSEKKFSNQSIIFPNNQLIYLWHLANKLIEMKYCNY